MAVPIGHARRRQAGRDVTLLAWGNTMEKALEAVAAVGDEISIELIDLRSIVPWDHEMIEESVRKTGRLVVVQEDTENCSVGQMIISHMAGRPDVWSRMVAPPVLVSKGNVMIGYNPIYEYAALPDTPRIIEALRRVLATSVERGGYAAPSAAPFAPPPPAASVSASDPAHAPVNSVVPGTSDISVKVPIMGEGLRSARVVALHKQAGDKVSHDDVLCEVVDGGMLGEHQGINLPGAVLSVPSLTAKDKKDLKFGLEAGVDLVAISFVRSAKDVKAVQRIIAAAGKDTPVIAKLEKPQAIENLDEILEVAGGVMVARGDLGVEMPPEQVPIIQKHVIRRAQRWRKPVITATQMLDSMIQNPRPTRAEASDVANAIYDGSDAVMLSGETASGRYPREAVSMMARIVTEAEADIRRMGMHIHRTPPAELTIPEAICESVAHIAEELKMCGIAVFTASGTTAGLISKYRPRVEVYGFSHVPSVVNRLNLCWGVRPVLIRPTRTVDEMVGQAETSLRRLGNAATGDVVAIVAGVRMITPGATNFIRLHRIRPLAGERRQETGKKNHQ